MGNDAIGILPMQYQYRLMVVQGPAKDAEKQRKGAHSADWYVTGLAITINWYYIGT